MRAGDVRGRFCGRLRVGQIDADVFDLEARRLHIERDHLISALEQPLRHRPTDAGASARSHRAIRGRVRNYRVSQIISCSQIISYEVRNSEEELDRWEHRVAVEDVDTLQL